MTSLVVLDAVDTPHIADELVVAAGDWHGAGSWIDLALAVARRAGVRTVLHVGDFDIWPGSFQPIDRAARRHGIHQILVTPGNHEHWGALTPLFQQHPGKVIRVSDSVWVQAPGSRLLLGPQRRSLVSLGGAPSVDRHLRTPGRDWWPEETIAPADVARTVAGGRADVMIAHDTVDGSGVIDVERILLGATSPWPSSALADAAEGRKRLTEAWDAVHPKLLLHGHYHVRGSGIRADGRRVEALGCDGDETGNLIVLDTTSLDIEPLPVVERASSWIT